MKTQKLQETTGSTRRLCPAYRIAATLLIQAEIEKGAEVVVLHDLYNKLNADVEQRRNGIQWAVRDCKDDNLIRKSKVQGVYTVVR
jgi:hypothetical protein